MGLEPTNAGATDQCVNPFATTAAIFIGRGSRNRTHTKGFGDLCSTFKLCPYKIEKKMEADGFEPPNSKRADLQSAVFSHFTKPP